MRKLSSFGARMRSVRRRPATPAACCAAIIFFLTAQQAAEATSASINLAGRVYEQAALMMSQFSISISATGAERPMDRKITKGGNVWLTDLGVSGNGADFTVSVHSHNAEASGHPGLVDAATGARIAYRLNFGGEPVDFKSGEATLGKGRTSSDKIATPRPLALVLPSDVDLGRARFREQIVVVIQAH